MTPTMMTLFSLGIAIPMVLVNLVLPTFNMQMRMNRDELLRQNVMNVVNQNRHQPNVLAALLVPGSAAIRPIQGINIQNINRTSSGQYDIYTVTYTENNLFFNQFFTPAHLQGQTKNIQVLVDRVI